MSRYTVVWSRDVRDDFIEHWLNSQSEQRKRLTEVANRVDRELASAPDQKGVPLPSEPSLQV